MTFLRKLAAFTLCAAAVCGAHAGTSATPATPQTKTPATELILVGLGLVAVFGRRKAVRSEPWSN